MLIKADVRFGSKADICTAPAHVRFTPDSGHVQCNAVCLLSARSRHAQRKSRGFPKAKNPAAWAGLLLSCIN
jgi:hypothetical protein